MKEALALLDTVYETAYAVYYIPIAEERRVQFG